MKYEPVCVALLITVAVAWPARGLTDSTTHRQSVEQLFELTRLQEKIDSSVENVMALQLQQNPDLREHEQILKRFLERNIGWTGLQEDLVKMYMQAFTEQELNEINAFYRTPTGQKLIRQLPELVQQRDRLAMQRLQQNIGELQKEIADTGKK